MHEHAPYMPPEILEQIFENTVAPRIFLDTRRSVRFEKDSSYRRNLCMKLALSGVCKAWNGAANRFIYREVYLWDLHQASEFAKTIEESPKGLGVLVSSLFFQDIPIPDSDSGFAIFQIAVNHICEMCPNLSSLSLKPSLDVDGNRPSSACDSIQSLRSPARSTIPFWRSGRQVRELSLSVRLLQRLCPDINTGISSTIERLTLFFDSLTESVPYIFPVVWPLLRSLTCDLHYTSISGGTSPSVVILRGVEHFSMPRLFAVTIALPTTSELDDVPLFIQEYAPQIKYLNLGSTRHSRIFIPALFDMLPSLEHLVLKNGYQALSQAQYHPSLKYLDLWYPFPDSFEDDQANIRGAFNADTDIFPNLKAIRLFDEGLNSKATDYDLPFIFPPDCTGSESDYQIRYLGVDIDIKAGGTVFCQNDLDYCGETDTDSSYSQSDSEHSSSSEYWSDTSAPDSLYESYAQSSQ